MPYLCFQTINPWIIFTIRFRQFIFQKSVKKCEAKNSLWAFHDRESNSSTQSLFPLTLGIWCISSDNVDYLFLCVLLILFYYLLSTFHTLVKEHCIFWGTKSCIILSLLCQKSLNSWKSSKVSLIQFWKLLAIFIDIHSMFPIIQESYEHFNRNSGELSAYSSRTHGSNTSGPHFNWDPIRASPC